MLFDCKKEKEKAPCKLLQQFAKCTLCGCEHPLCRYKYYATSNVKMQEEFEKFQISLQFNRQGGIIFVKI